MLLFFQNDGWSWTGTLPIISYIAAAVLGFAAFVKALTDLKKLGWDAFRDKWIRPRKAAREELKKKVDAIFEQNATMTDLRGKVDQMTRHVYDLGTAQEDMSHQVAEIFKEVKPNGGGSLKDQITGISLKLDSVIAERRHQKETSAEAIFDLDADGELVYSNAAFRDLVHADESQVHHNNYISLMEEEDQARFIRARDQAIRLKTPIDITVAFRCEVDVRIQASPYFKTAPKSDEGYDLAGFFCSASEVADG